MACTNALHPLLQKRTSERAMKIQEEPPRYYRNKKAA